MSPPPSPISPKPRKFTFPDTHNLSDSPCPSPCASPFEPERHSTPTTPLSIDTFTVAFSQSTSLASPSSSSSPTVSKRRKSSQSPDVERLPKKGEQDYVKRPENAFMLFRRHYCDNHFRVNDSDGDDKPKKPRQADLSKMISQEWKSLSTEERAQWHQLAAERKKQHGEKYPHYVYRPQRQRDEFGNVKKNRKRVKRGDHDPEKDPPEHITFVLPNQTGRFQRRSLSAPTPPVTYQTIHVPNVYMTPSCPTSPSLFPLSKRRSSHPGHPEDVMSSFDYLPTNSPPDASNFQPSNFTWEIPPEQPPFDSSCTNIFPPPPSSTTGYPSATHSPPSPEAPLTPTGLGEPFKLEPTEWQPPAFADTTEEFWNQDPNCQVLMEFNSPWDNGLSWQSGPMFNLDDFDINAIPTAQLTESCPQFDESWFLGPGGQQYDSFLPSPIVPSYPDEAAGSAGYTDGFHS